MGFLKYAKANLVSPLLNERGWDKIRVASTGNPLPVNLIEQASEILKENFSPSNYLLTHSTIVGSVGTEAPQDVEIGRVKFGSQFINRLYSDYYVKPESEGQINNNGDSWSHAVLMKSYKTFIGAHNWVEHVQMEELSKGRVIDAIAREVADGNSIYVDILVATHRKHADLIEQIKSGELSTLSMGCSVDSTTCTKCGHVAADEPQMCSHVRFEKHNHFYDSNGIRRKVAELCGHESMDPTAGVHFIDASWVKVPAFTGAVLRNIVGEEDLSPDMAQMAQKILSSPPTEWSSNGIDAFMKAASVIAASYKKAQFEDEGEGGDEKKDEKKEEGNPLDGLTSEVYDFVTEKVKKKIQKDMAGKKPDDKHEKGSMDPNENVVKEASKIQRVSDTYNIGIAALVKTARCKEDLIRSVASFNEVFQIKVPKRLYMASLKIGSTGRYGSLDRYLKACHKVLGRKASLGEAKTLIRLGQLLSNLENK